MSKYKRKTTDEWHILVWYGSHGWEHETTETKLEGCKGATEMLSRELPAISGQGDQAESEATPVADEPGTQSISWLSVRECR